MFSSQNLGGQKPPLLVMLVNYRLKNKIKRQLWTRGNTGWKNKNLNKKIFNEQLTMVSQNRKK